MALLQVLLLIGAVGNSVPHIIFKEPPRFQVSRIAFNEWRPLRHSTGQLVRYPVYKKVYSPTKKDGHDLAVDGSDQIVQHFSPAPPSILGSLSMFGHATVKARQHASQGAKNTRASLDTRTYYQSPHKHVGPYLVYKDPPKRPSSSQSTSTYHRQPYYSEERSPNSHFQQTQSTSLAANSYYFDQQHPFIPSSRDHSYEKVRKPVAETYNLQYSIPTLDYQGLAFYNPNNYQEFYRNPFGDIRLGGDREAVHVDGPPEHVDPLYESVSLGKPFHHNSGITSTKPTGTFTPVVTTYSSLAPSPATPAHPSKLSTIKFSQVAQPFQAVTSKPLVENEFTESVYPLTVTTIDIPEALVTENGNSGSKIDNLGGRITNTASKIESTPAEQLFTRAPVTTNSYSHQVFNRHPSQAVIVSSEQTFLPTPATGPWSVPQTVVETNDEFTTQQQILDTTVDDGSEDENVATVMTTVTAPVETTTIKKIKSRRRPHRRPASSTKPTYERLTEESTTTMDFSKYNRRRKPVNKNYTNTDDIKRLRTSTTTSTTTVAPIIEENTDFTTETDYITEPAIFTSSAVQNIEQTGQDTLNVVKFEETTPDTLKIISSTVEPSLMSSSTTTPATLASKIRIKYGNRPRFSVKDYRERLKMTSTTTAPDAGDPIRNRTESKSKQRVATEKSDSSAENSEVTTEPKYRYKPRLTPSRYKSSSTTPAPTDTPTERVNSFRPSSNRYKSSGGKYYSRYRTSTASTRELEENQATSTARVTMKTKGVFSAKRRPFPFKQKVETPITMEGSPTEILKIKENEVIPSSPTKSAEELVTSMTTTTSKEDHSADPTGEEATKIADLTSSSTNEFHQTSSVVVKANRPRPNILLPKDDPILPLEAFFQTQSKDS